MIDFRSLETADNLRFQLANELSAIRLRLQKATWLRPLPDCSSISSCHWPAVRGVRVVREMICSWLSSAADYPAKSVCGRTV